MDDGLKLNRKQRAAITAALDLLYNNLDTVVSAECWAKYDEARKILAAPATTAPLYSDD